MQYIVIFNSSDGKMSTWPEILNIQKCENFLVRNISDKKKICCSYKEVPIQSVIPCNYKGKICFDMNNYCSIYSKLSNNKMY